MSIGLIATGVTGSCIGVGILAAFSLMMLLTRLRMISYLVAALIARTVLARGRTRFVVVDDDEDDDVERW